MVTYSYIHRTQLVPVNIPRAANYEIKFIEYRPLRWILKRKKKKGRKKEEKGREEKC